MAIRHLALMTLAAVAAGACVNARRKHERMNRSGRKPAPLQTWESEGGLAAGRSSSALPGVTGDRPSGTASRAHVDEPQKLPVRGDDVLSASDERPPASGSSPLPAGQNLP